MKDNVSEEDKKRDEESEIRLSESRARSGRFSSLAMSHMTSWLG